MFNNLLAPVGRHLRRAVLAGALALALVGTTGCYWSVSHSPAPRRVVVVDSPTTTARYDWVFYPTCDVYYNTSSRVWVFYDGGVWVQSYSLPTRYQVSLGHRVVVDYVGPKPYVHLHVHRERAHTGYYARYTGGNTYRYDYQSPRSQYAEHRATYERSYHKPPTQNYQHHQPAPAPQYNPPPQYNQGGSSGPSQQRPGPSNNYGSNNNNSGPSQQRPGPSNNYNGAGGDAGPSNARPR